MSKFEKVIVAISAAYVFVATVAVVLWYTNQAAKYAMDMAIWQIQQGG